jgi:hypothetical protein
MWLMQRRPWPLLDPLLFGGMVVAYLVAVPLGLARAGAATAVAQGVTLGGGIAPGTPALPVLAIRLLCFLPLGDLATRASVASALAAAAAAVLLARASCEALLAARREGAAGGLVEPVAAAGGAAIVGLSLGAFGDATGAGPAGDHRRAGGGVVGVRAAPLAGAGGGAGGGGPWRSWRGWQRGWTARRCRSSGCPRS